MYVCVCSIIGYMQVFPLNYGSEITTQLWNAVVAPEG